MNINDIYSETFYVIAHKETGKVLFGTRLFKEKEHAKTAWWNAVGRGRRCHIYKLERLRCTAFDNQDEYEIVEVVNTIHLKIN